MIRPTLRATAALALLVLVPGLALAQGEMQEEVAELKTALAENAAAQRNYTWLESTKLAYEGEAKSTSTKSCQYYQGSGKPNCTVVSQSEPKKTRGPLRKSIVESKEKELKAYMDSVITLVGRYVPPESSRIQAAQQQGGVAVAPNPSNGTVKFIISNYLQQGDQVTVVYRKATKQLVGLQINTWLNDPSATVTLAVQFVTLPNGVTFTKESVLTATAKKVVVTTTSSNFAQAVAQ